MSSTVTQQVSKAMTHNTSIQCIYKLGHAFMVPMYDSPSVCYQSFIWSCPTHWHLARRHQSPGKLFMEKELQLVLFTLG